MTARSTRVGDHPRQKRSIRIDPTVFRKVKTRMDDILMPEGVGYTLSFSPETGELLPVVTFDTVEYFTAFRDAYKFCVGDL